MSTPILERFRAIDTDTHLTEPADVWTARMPSSWGDDIPHVKRISDATLQKVLHDNAAALYGIS